MDAKQFSDLLQRYCLGTCTDDEKQWVESWYNERRRNVYNPLPEAEEELAGERMYRAINEMITAEPPAIVIPIWRRRIMWWSAACILVLLVTTSYFVFNHKTVVHVTVKTNHEPAVQPVQPGGNKAVLTLADGSTIVLDSAANGALAQQGKTIVFKKKDGELVYHSKINGNQDVIAWNTISTPRGGQYQVVLPDGTKVWLNAVSSLRFPSSFSRKERVVQLTGEAYLEVAPLSLTPGKKVPFIVDIIKGGRIEVLGTHFNINAYDDEAAIKTTLLEGSVKVVQSVPTRPGTNEQSAILKPGEQAEIAANLPLTIDHSPDVDQVVAWKNGRFQFNNADVQSVMREIARWYDVEIAYAGKVPAEKFEGEIPRNSSINEVFKILELSNVHCKIEGKKITVLP
ncbi:hypothetical protein A3860_22205 [Niastella vici]|uniref:Iron dicitrate transport regulator FecR n=1 Tax=Niastella vici TaxID=1703345 RepID=A0A1V9G0H6_9BACT|nr:FecR family protein [Niastella vici]OQP64121.1 hypothetical protein A3860_22205 [Niastella vici]